MVHTHHKHGSISRRCGNNDPFGPILQVGSCLLHGGKETSRPHDILSTSITPFDVGGISLLEDGDGRPIDDKVPILSIDCAIQLAMGGVILAHVNHVVVVNETVIDGNNVHFARYEGSLGNQVLNMTKSVHSGLHCCLRN